MCSTRSEAGRAYGKKTMSEKWPSDPSIRTMIFTLVKLVVSPIPTLDAADPKTIESCARNQKHPLSITGRGLRILPSHNNNTCKGRHHILCLPPPVISSALISRLCCSRPTSLSLSTIALSAMPCPCHSQLEHKPCLIWSFLQKEKRSNDYSPLCEPNFAKRLTHRCCAVVKAPTDQCHQ